MAHAPSRAASSASSTPVMPQNLTRIPTRLRATRGGARSALGLDVRRAVAERDGDPALLAAVDNRQLDRIARLLRADVVDDVGHRVHSLPVDCGDDVAAGVDAGAVDGRRGARVAALDAGLLGGPARGDGLDQRALIDREVEDVRDLRRQIGPADAEVGMLDAAVLEQLLDDAADRVAGDREADADVAAAVGRLDLRVDADDLAAGVDEGAAGVARVDRRVGLDHVVDREAVRRLDLALERRDDARGHRPVETERIADRDHRIADVSI